MIQQQEDLPWSAARTQGARSTVQEGEKKLICLEHSFSFSCPLFSYSCHFLCICSGSMESSIQAQTVPSFVLVSSLTNKAWYPNLTQKAVFLLHTRLCSCLEHPPALSSPSSGKSLSWRRHPTFLSTSCPRRGKIT